MRVEVFVIVVLPAALSFAFRRSQIFKAAQNCHFCKVSFIQGHGPLPFEPVEVISRFSGATHIPVLLTAAKFGNAHSVDEKSLFFWQHCSLCISHKTVTSDIVAAVLISGRSEGFSKYRPSDLLKSCRLRRPLREYAVKDDSTTSSQSPAASAVPYECSAYLCAGAVSGPNTRRYCL